MKNMNYKDYLTKDNKLTARLYNFIIANKFQLILLSLIAIFVFIPTLKTGIIQNDELQHRLNASDLSLGFKHYVSALFAQGRGIGFLSTPFLYLFAFLSPNVLWFDGIAVLTLISNVILFAILVKTLTKNKNLAFFTAALFMIFLPFSFEATIPNSFNISFGVTISLMFISFLLYNKYLHTGRGLIPSMILFFICCTTYELFIVYSVFYFILVLLKTRDIREIIKKLIVPFCVSIIYLILYLITVKLAIAVYDGAVVEIQSLSAVFHTIKAFILASFPGFLLFVPKNQYLFSLLSNSPAFLSQDVIISMIKSGDIFTVLANVFTPFMHAVTPRIVLFATFSALSIKKSLNLSFKPQIKPINDINSTNTANVAKNKRNYTNFWACIFISLIFIILPAIPQSLTQMYQEYFLDGIASSFSVSYFISFATIFLISYILYTICTSKHKVLGVFCTIAIVLYSVPIQSMNTVFIEEQSKNYTRLTTIEEFFETNTATLMNGHDIYAPDLYKTVWAMGIHDGYWTNYISRKHDISATIGNDGYEDSDIKLYFDDEIFTLINDDEIAVFIKDRPIEGIHPVKVSDMEFLAADFTQNLKDGEFYIYFFNKGDKLETSHYTIFADTFNK